MTLTPHLRAVIIVLTVVLLPAAGAQAQSGSLMEAFNQYRALYQQGRYAEAEPFAAKALELAENRAGLNPSATAVILNDVALLYQAQGRYDTAEPLLKRSLAIREKVLGADHPDVGVSLSNLAVLYLDQGRYDAAEPLLKRSLAIREKALNADHSDVGIALNNLAQLYQHQGHYDAAEPLLKRSLAIREKALGADHPDVGVLLDNLADLYRTQGRYSAAEPLYKRSLAIREKALGGDHPEVGVSLNNLAELYQALGRYSKAELLYKRSLVLRENALGADHPYVGRLLNNLASLYIAQGRYGEAEPFLKRSLAIRENALGANHPHVGYSLNSLAELYRTQGRYGDAEPLYMRSLVIAEKALGADHLAVGVSLNDLALLYRAQGRYDAAEPLFKRSLATKVKAVGADHPDVGRSLSNLAVLYQDQGRYGEAEPLLKRSLVILEEALGADHPDVSASLNNLAVLYQAQDRYTEALNSVRKASAIHRRRSARSAGQRSGGGLSEQRSVRPIFVNHVGIGFKVLRRDPMQRTALTAELFEAGQLAQSSSAAGAVAQMAARFAAGNDRLAGLVRARQDAFEQWQRIDTALVEAVSRPPGKRDQGTEREFWNQLGGLDRRIGGLDGRLAADFPAYAELATPRPARLVEVQKLLAEDEALISYLVSDGGTFIWVMRRDRSQMISADIGRVALNAAITALRKALDPPSLQSLSNVPPFDTTKAFELYQKIFQPVEPMLDGARHVFVVPDGALQSLPLGVLVTAKPQAPVTDFTGYRQTPWLAKRYAMTTLPSVSALRALRVFAKAAKASKPFVGFGDPLLEGHPQGGRGPKLAALFTPRGIADLQAVRSLSALPETARELQALAKELGASRDDLFLRETATEGQVKSADLSEYRVLAFATHALVAGDLTGLAEPALVLTPPGVATKDDDGLLTASEVATLKLDADWVILSACNTAAPDGTPGADALSGLAKAFFYAGSRALLVSHWPVVSDAATALTTGMFMAMADDPGIGRAEALRRSMMAMMKRSYLAHPLFWAPFVVVGEGGAVQK